MIDEKSQETILVPHALGNIIHVGPIMRLNLCIKSRCMRARPGQAGTVHCWLLLPMMMMQGSGRPGPTPQCTLWTGAEGHCSQPSQCQCTSTSIT